jgi:hypothetical protein
METGSLCTSSVAAVQPVPANVAEPVPTEVAADQATGTDNPPTAMSVLATQRRLPGRRRGAHGSHFCVAVGDGDSRLMVF